jgi:CubicO group peptidase (beta-lactamase class C family)
MEKTSLDLYPEIIKMWRSVTLCCVFSILLLSFASSQTPLDTSETDRKNQKVEAYLFTLFKDTLPGCAVGIVQKGRIIYAKGFGIADMDHSISITPHTLFNVASISKQFTAMSIALLADSGLISLKDPVSKFIPELPAFHQSITIEQLVYHTSGLRDYTELIEWSDQRIEHIHTDSSILALVRRQKALNYEPGEKHAYSNTGYFLMGVIVQRVTGLSLAQYQKQTIFDPLKMQETVLYDNRNSIMRNRASGYYIGDDGNFQRRASLWDRVGDGGLLTSVTDLAKWDQNFYKPLVGNHAIIQRAMTPGKLNNGASFEYGYGLEPSKYRGLNLVYHGGGIRGFRSQMFRFPDQETSFICLCNNQAVSPTVIVQKLADIYLSDHFKVDTNQRTIAGYTPEIIQLPQSALRQYEGLFSHEEQAIVRRTRVMNDTLWYERSESNRTALLPYQKDRFFMAGSSEVVSVSFSRNAAGKIDRFSLVIGERKPIKYHLVQVPLTMREASISYQGFYYSDELETGYHLLNEGGKIVVTKKDQSRIYLTPLYRDVFTDHDGLLKFEFLRNKQKEITGISLSSERARGVLFKKQR